MLLCQQQPALIQNSEENAKVEWDTLTCAELAAQLRMKNNNTDTELLIIDCGSPLRHNERRIQGSLSINVNDRISRKRLTARGLRNFLDKNQLALLNKNDNIVMYDDYPQMLRPCNDPAFQYKISPTMKCVHDEIKRYNSNKRIYILQATFDEFYHQYAPFCVVNVSNNHDMSVLSPTINDQEDIDSVKMSQVLPGLYLGNANDAESLTMLKQNQIQVIVNISTTIPCFHINDPSFEYKHVECYDSASQDILGHFESVCSYIGEKLSENKNVLVHCQAGISRSPSFVIGYLMRYQSYTLEKALDHVKNCRSIISPNFNFLGQLIQYQHLIKTY